MKRQFLLLLVALTTTTIFESCYTYETVTKYEYVSRESEYNQKYLGKTKTQIINVFGAPDRIVQIEGNSVIVIYETISETRYDHFLGGASYYTYRSYIEFYLDNNSKCYMVKTNHGKSVPYQETIKKSIFEP